LIVTDGATPLSVSGSRPLLVRLETFSTAPR
jgi:hypothetical protein